VGFEATILRLRGGKQVLLQRFVSPGSLDLLSVEFGEREDADGFVPPAWFGPEVTQNPAFDRGSLARAGMPASEEIPLSNAVLEELLDVIEEGTIAAQLSRGPSLTPRGDQSAEGHTEGSSSDASQVPAPPTESAQTDGLMAGLAEALKDVQPAQSALDPDDASAAREAARGERARPRLLRGGWQ
jgi:hypothetical protein